MKKINKPVILLAVSVIVCLFLLFWNANSQGGDDKPEKEETVVSEFSTPENSDLEQTVATNTGTSLEETPNEMYKRISKQKNAEVNVREEKAVKKAIQTPKKVVVNSNSREDEAEETGYVPTRNERPKNEPVEVPAGRSIRVTLSENLSSEDESRDGGVLRFTCAENVEAEGRIIIRKGASVTGKIVDVISSRNERKKALVGFTLQRIQATDGSSIKLHSQRYRLFGDEPGRSVSYRSGQSFTAELGRGKVQ